VMKVNLETALHSSRSAATEASQRYSCKHMGNSRLLWTIISV